MTTTAPARLSNISRCCFGRAARLGIVLSLVTLLGWPAHGHADLVIQAQNSMAVPGGTGAFDVTITNNGIGGLSYDVDGFSIDLSVLASTGVQFTSVTMGTSNPYLFVTPGPPPFSFDTFPNTNFIASDAEFAPPGFTTIAPGQTFGLAHVSYSVSPGASPLSSAVVTFGPATDVSGTTSAGGNPPIGAGDFVTVPGTISIGQASVPEPSALALMGIGGSILLMTARRRKKHAKMAGIPS